MARWWKAAGLLVVAIAAVLVVPAFSVGFGAPMTSLTSIGGAAPAHASTGSPTAVDSAFVAGAVAASAARHIPKVDMFLPNVADLPTVSNGVVQPLYTASPAPMGLGYFGVHESHGVNVGTVSYYPSIEGAVTLNSVDPFYLASSSPDIFTMQLNTVLTHVDVLGNTSGAYWIQNVPVYYAASQTLTIEDNIWNFTAPGAAMQANTLHSYDGYLFPGEYYYAPGPVWHVPTPFTVQLYNNASIVNKRPTVFFNYSITEANGTVLSGSYDRVEFDSAVAPTHAAPRPVFQIDGKQTNAFGLLNDAEIMLGGPGGGSTTTLLGINATMGLWTRANGSATYVAVPAASDFGTDTGETSEGIAEWTPGPSNPIAVLGEGPSLLGPLWGLVGAHSGFIRTTFDITPTNAFAFANAGTVWNENTAAWAPVPVSGVATFQLPPGSYSFDFLLSDHTSVAATVSATTTLVVHLAKNAATGVDTPLWAWNDAQLGAISSGGSGTRANPYVLDDNSVGSVSALFGEFNDYEYPVFPGILIGDTTAFVTATGLPDFSVPYTLPVEAHASAQFGTPLSNNLGLQFYNDTHISLVSNPQITGWTFAYVSYNPEVLFWNTSDSLIAGNTFQDQGIGVMLSGGADNVVWGNVFSPSTTTAVSPGSVYAASTQNGLQSYESGDLVYNNAFLTPVTAVTPPFDLYTGAPSLWTDRWNVTPQPATDVRSVNGWPLSGNILGGATEGGNYWSNYGTPSNPFGVVPYTDSGGIYPGGDSHPLVLATLHHIVVTETGLASGTSWSVTMDGYTQTATTSSMTFWEPNGLYAYSVGHVPGYTVHPSTGAVTVRGGPATVTVKFT
jgi:thermopsin